MKKLLTKLFRPRAKKATAGEIAKKFGLKIQGDARRQIISVAPIMDAAVGDASFYSTERNSSAFRILPISVLENTKASVILLQPESVPHAPKGATLLISDSPRNDVIKILDYLYAEKPKRGISLDAIVARGVFFRKKKSVYIAPFAIVERGAAIEEGVQILSGAYVGRNCHIGKNTIIHQNAVIENATIGDDCVIHNGASIGKAGFGYTRKDGHNVFISHAGRVILGNRVDVGANSCIDRGMLTDTTIGDGTKIDNLCQIAHGVIIGKEVFMAAGTGIAGGVVIGDRVMMGGHSAVPNGIHIGDDVELAAKSAPINDLESGKKYFGWPAFPSLESMRMIAWTRKNALGKK